MLASDDQGGGSELVTYQKCPFTVVQILKKCPSKFIHISHLLLTFERERTFSNASSLVRAFDKGT
jgi:hypothetical protein